MNGFIELVEKLRFYTKEEELISVLNSLNGIIYPLEGLHRQVRMPHCSVAIETINF